LQLQNEQASLYRPQGDLGSDLRGPPLPEVRAKPGPAPALPASPQGRNWCFMRGLHVSERQSRGHRVNSDSGHKGGKPVLYHRATQVLNEIHSYLRTNINIYWPNSSPGLSPAGSVLQFASSQRSCKECKPAENLIDFISFNLPHRVLLCPGD